MGAGARRWRRSNFPNLTEHIAPHKDGIGISDAKAIVDAPLQHWIIYQAKPMPYRRTTPRRAVGIASADARGRAIGMPLCGNDNRRRAMAAGAAVRQRIAQLAGDQ